MQFKKYNSIENHYQQKFIDACIPVIGDYEDWIVQEKIHWSNFSFYCDDKLSVRCAKRTDFIHEWEKFFNYESVLDKYKDKIVDIYKEIISRSKDATEIIVYWELYWAWVQKWVYYSNEKDFVAFDILVDWEYLSVDMCNTLFDNSWIPRLDVLSRWYLRFCMDYDCNKNSLLAEKLWQCNVEWNNIMEWVIIRTNTPIFLPWWSRVIFKKKNDKFMEKKSERKEPIVFESLWSDVISQYANDNRMQSVISKLWEITDKNKVKDYAVAFVQDTIEDVEKDWLSLSKYDRQMAFKIAYQLALQNIT